MFVIPEFADFRPSAPAGQQNQQQGWHVYSQLFRIDCPRTVSPTRSMRGKNMTLSSDNVPKQCVFERDFCAMSTDPGKRRPKLKLANRGPQDRCDNDSYCT